MSFVSLTFNFYVRRWNRKEEFCRFLVLSGSKPKPSSGLSEQNPLLGVSTELLEKLNKHGRSLGEAAEHTNLLCI